MLVKPIFFETYFSPYFYLGNAKLRYISATPIVKYSFHSSQVFRLRSPIKIGYGRDPKEFPLIS